MIRITAPHFCAAVILGDNGRVVRTAPILHYMRGWSLASVLAYVSGRAANGWSADERRCA